MEGEAGNPLRICAFLSREFPEHRQGKGPPPWKGGESVEVGGPVAGEGREVAQAPPRPALCAPLSCLSRLQAHKVGKQATSFLPVVI